MRPLIVLMALLAIALLPAFAQAGTTVDYADNLDLQYSPLAPGGELLAESDAAAFFEVAIQSKHDVYQNERPADAEAGGDGLTDAVACRPLRKLGRGLKRLAGAILHGRC